MVDGLLVLHLAGTPYEIGYQHGALARREIHGFRRAAYRYLHGEVAAVLGLPHAAARLITRPLLMWQAAGFLPHIPPAYQEEMRGLAAGAGVHFLEALLLNVIWELSLAGGCSEFAVRGRKSADGALLHGYNYDLLDPAQAFIVPYLALIFYRPAGGTPFAQLNMIGSVGVNAGMSAHGLSVAWDNTIARKGASLLAGAPRRCTPFMIALRDLLEHGETIEHTARILRGHLPRPTADIIIVGQARGDRAAALETGGAALELRPIEEDAIWNANSFVSPAMAPHDRPGPPGGRVGESGNSQGRYSAYAELLGPGGAPLDVAGAVAVLRDPYPREHAGYAHPPARLRTICRPFSAFSMVMRPGAGQLWAAATQLPAPLGSYTGFDLASEAPLAGQHVAASGYRAALSGYRYYTLGWHAQAAAALEQALAIDGERAPTRLLLAQVYAALGQTDRAAEQLALVRAAGAQPGRRLAFPSAIMPLVMLEGHTVAAAHPG